MRRIGMFCAGTLETVAATLAILVSGVCAFSQARASAAQAVKNRAEEASGCGSAAFLTSESGKFAAVDWVARTGNRIHTRAVQTQSEIVGAKMKRRHIRPSVFRPLAKQAEPRRPPAISAKKPLTGRLAFPVRLSRRLRARGHRQTALGGARRLAIGRLTHGNQG
jgi:hypothetical protein